ncbi:MAG: M48 family metallopeptidase [Candidatus Gastranaerophilales bacterium]|nr:M48 family metallopeptidase [Candidatus Gastranaerophilales bacterium]
MNKISKFLFLCLIIIIGSFSFAFADDEQLQLQIQKIKAQHLDKETELYKIAHIEMDNDSYKVYRTAERLIRANNLSEYPWTFIIKYEDDYAIDASTTQGNLININYGLVKTFSDDISMLAFVLAHEMAHEELKHIAKNQRKLVYLKEQLNEAVKRYEQHADNTVKNYNLVQKILGLGLPYHTTEDLENERKKVEKLQKELDEESYATIRKNEYEADRTALKYMAKAGFETDKATNLFDFLLRFENYDKDEKNITHPTPQNRIWQIERELESLDVAKLNQEGNSSIKNSKPLTYEILTKYVSRRMAQRIVVINSKYGTSQDKNDPFVKLFGK